MRSSHQPSASAVRKRVTHIIAGLGDGGAEAVLFRLCTEDTNNQHAVVSLGDAGKYGALLKERGVSLTTLGMKRGRLSVLGLWLLWKTLRESRPDIVQTWMYHANLLGGLLARFAGCRHVIWGIHNSNVRSDSRSRRVVLWATIWLSYVVPRHIVCCAEKARTVHEEIGYDRTRMSVIPNGYDLTRFRPDPVVRDRTRLDLALPPQRLVIGFVARYDPLKDHENLLAALAHLKARGIGVTCLLVGSGMEPSNEHLVSEIARYDLADSVRLLGRRSDIPAIMNVLDLHIMSSASEAFPNVLAEAMACGVPCVTTDVGDAAGIVAETGWVAAPRDSSALAAALSTALTAEHEELLSRGRAARERVEEYYSLAAMIAKYTTLYLRLDGAE